MSRILRLFVAVVLVVGGAFATGSWTHAQNRTPGLGNPLILEGPTVLSGSDIGFRVDRQRGDTPVGALVVRVNGRWVEPEYSRVAKPLDDR